MICGPGRHIDFRFNQLFSLLVIDSGWWQGSERVVLLLSTTTQPDNQHNYDDYYNRAARNSKNHIELLIEEALTLFIWSGTIVWVGHGIWSWYELVRINDD